MNRTREFHVTVGDGSITGTVTMTADEQGQMSFVGDWSFPEGNLRAYKECEVLLKKVLRIVLAEEGKVANWSGVKWL
jgi:hypothetical protein